MHLKLSPEAILSQLGYNTTPQAIKQMENIIKHTRNFNRFSSHLLSLNDHLAPLKAFIAMSNSVPYLKIKLAESIAPEMVNEFNDIVKKWALKYKIRIQKVPNKSTYYILGQ